MRGRRLRLTLPLALSLAFSLLATGCASLDPAVLEEILGSATATAPLDESTVILGLKEALRVGTARAVERVSREDGYWRDELIRIRLPEQLEEMADVLRRIGFSRQVDELELAMNRAAEKAAGEAVDVFANALFDMTIADGWAILRGGDSAATAYFRDRTWSRLEERFQPIIDRTMSQIGLSRQYEQLAGRYNALPFVTRPAVDLDAYLTDRALDGLFHELAEEEGKIRADPIARTTELLRKVFRSR